MPTSAPILCLPSCPHSRGADDPRVRVAVLLALMRNLQGVMQAENVLLRELRLDRLRELQAEKAALVESYELALCHLRQRPELLTALSEEDRGVLDAAVRELPAAARRNTERLTHARAAVDDVARAIEQSLGSIGDGCGLVLRPRLVSRG